MSEEYTTVANIKLHKQEATDLSFDELQTWVIWQFPRKKKSGLCGAVRPPMAEYEWYPALVHVKEQRVDVLAHLDQQFATPESAAEFVENMNDDS